MGESSFRYIQKIQIHLMFLFIYRRMTAYKEILKIQIHLMFLFIGCPYKYGATGPEFKYISCSYLSFLRTLQYQHVYYSNTSHVLIYRVVYVLFKTESMYSNTSHVLIYQ